MATTLKFPGHVRAKPAPKPPDGLSSASRAWWKRLQADYGVEDSAGLALLQTAAECVARIEQARAILDQEGIMVADRFGTRRAHPMLLVERDARAQLMAALRGLRLDIEPLQPRPGRPGGGQGS